MTISRVINASEDNNVHEETRLLEGNLNTLDLKDPQIIQLLSTIIARMEVEQKLEGVNGVETILSALRNLIRFVKTGGNREGLVKELRTVDIAGAEGLLVVIPHIDFEVSQEDCVYSSSLVVTTDSQGNCAIRLDQLDILNHGYSQPAGAQLVHGILSLGETPIYTNELHGARSEVFSMALTVSELDSDQ